MSVAQCQHDLAVHANVDRVCRPYNLAEKSGIFKGPTLISSLGVTNLHCRLMHSNCGRSSTDLLQCCKSISSIACLVPCLLQSLIFCINWHRWLQPSTLRGPSWCSCNCHRATIWRQLCCKRAVQIRMGTRSYAYVH